MKRQLLMSSVLASLLASVVSAQQALTVSAEPTRIVGSDEAEETIFSRAISARLATGHLIVVDGSVNEGRVFDGNDSFVGNRSTTDCSTAYRCHGRSGHDERDQGSIHVIAKDPAGVIVDPIASPQQREPPVSVQMTTQSTGRHPTTRGQCLAVLAAAFSVTRRSLERKFAAWALPSPGNVLLPEHARAPRADKYRTSLREENA